MPSSGRAISCHALDGFTTSFGNLIGVGQPLLVAAQPLSTESVVTEHKPRPFRVELPNGGISFDIALDAPCPCASGRPTDGCCLRGGRIHTSASSTTPVGPMMGISVPRCYAALLRDCAGGLSREHFVS
jgi:hypothetical protein